MGHVALAAPLFIPQARGGVAMLAIPAKLSDDTFDWNASLQRHLTRAYSQTLVSAHARSNAPAAEPTRRPFAIPARPLILCRRSSTGISARRRRRRAATSWPVVP